jgi:diaminopimelate epimerase
MCGNGARCAARWAAERTGTDAIMLDTQAGTRRAEIDGETVTIEMGHPSFAPGSVPLAPDREDALVEEVVAGAEAVAGQVDGLEVTAVNTGVPHAVAFVEDVDAVDLESVAPAIRHAEVFPEGANVTVASPREDDGGDGDGEDSDEGIVGFDQRTYERGVEGETRSCGTGAVAIAVAARRLGKTTAEQVAVHPPGGRLEVGFRKGRPTLTGPTEREFSGEVSSSPEPRRIGEA